MIRLMNLDEHLLHLASRHRLNLWLTLGLGAVGGILTVAQAGLLSRTISLAFLGEAGNSSWLATVDEVPTLMALLLGVILCRAALVWGSELSAGWLALQVKQSVRQQLYERLQRWGPAYVRGERTGDLTATAMEGVESLEAYFSQYLPQLALAALVPLTILIFVFPLDWLSGLVLLLTAPLIPLFMILIGSVAQELTHRQWQTISRMSAYFLDVIQGLTALKILGRSRAQIQVIEQVNERFRLTTMSVLRVTFLSALVLELVATLSTAVVAVEVGLRLLYGRLAFEQALFVLVLAPEFYLPLRLLGTRFHAGMAGVAAAQRIFGVMETPIPDSQTTAAEQVPFAANSAQPLIAGDGALPQISSLPLSSLSFESVSYVYPGERQALRDVSFRMEANQKVALVGPSGAGKSTIAGLLLGFLQPQGGVIRVDGQPLSEISPKDWHSRLAWVPQNPYLFQGTLADNLRLARPGASQEALEQAARLANLDEFIQALPDGYETWIGERGIGLSGGQARRLALARAFLKDAPFLILDEATASLDPEQEGLIQQGMQRLLADRMVLMIAHRLNTVRQADWILVIDEGRIVEAGSHEDLLHQSGLYRQLTDFWQQDAVDEPIPVAGLSIQPHRSPDEMRENRHAGPAEHGWAAATLAATLPENVPGAIAPQDSGRPAGQPEANGQPLRRLLRLVTPFSGWAALSVLTGCAAIVCGIGLMATSAYILSAAALQPSIAELQVAIVGVRFFGIGRGIFRYLERNLSHEVTFRVLGRLRQSFYQALEPLAPACLQCQHSGDLLARIQNDIGALENFYVRVMAPLLVAVLVTLGVALWLGSFSLLLALALAAVWILAGVGLPWLIHALGRQPGRELVQERARLSSALVDSLQGMADLAVFDLAGREASRFRTANQKLGAAQWRLTRLGAMQTAFGGALAHLGMWLVLLLAIPLVSSGQLAGVTLATLALAALASFEAVSPLPPAAQHLESSLQSARRLYEIVDARPEIREPDGPAPVPQQPVFRLKEVSFTYPQAAGPSGASHPLKGSPALDQVSLHLAPARRVAVVGPSGAGKSTLAGLLLRFWEPQSGEIMVEEGAEMVGDHQALSSMPVSRCNSYELRSRVGLLSQQTYLFAASLRDNLRLARPKASQEEIEGAARRARLADWIETLPEGYDTWIGEQGLRLSAGERQRVAIARLLLQDAPLVILDEPTANLDARNEQAVLQDLLAAHSGRALLLITHRLVGLEDFDEIVVLHDGRVVQRGGMAALLATEGYFRRMWELQRGVLPDWNPNGGREMEL
jgi:ATP-binding cassette subfamily C protein CydCD